MIKNKKHFFSELALLPELSDNIIAKIFAINNDINISSKEKFYDNIKSYYQLYKKDKPIIELLEDYEDDMLKEWVGKDLRIKSVRLSGIRGIPVSSKKFGIDFIDENDEPQSMMILGENAVGKSSLFDALEYCYCNKVSEALLRAYQGDREKINYIKYLQHFDESVNDIFVEINTPSKVLKFSEENIPLAIRKRVNPDTHFISDYDIYINGQIDYDAIDSKNFRPLSSFHNMIAENLGFSELMQFEKYLKQFTLYKRQIESRNISSLQKSVDRQNDFILKNEEALKEKRIIIEKFIKESKLVGNENKTYKVLEEISKLIISDVAFSYDSNFILNSYKNYVESYEKYISKEQEQGSYTEIEFLKQGLELMPQKDNCPFCRNSNLNTKQIQEDVKLRIDKIFIYNDNIKRINSALDNQINSLKFFYSTINALINNINEEINNIKSIVDLNELFILEDKFIKDAYQIINSELFHEINRMEQNNSYFLNKYKFVYELDLKYKDFIEKEIIDFINTAVYFIQRRLGVIRVIQERAEGYMQNKTTSEQIVLLRNEIEIITKQIDDTKDNIKRDTKSINELLSIQKEFDEIKTEVSKYLKSYHSKLNSEINIVFEPIKQIVQEILKYYFELDNRGIDIKVDKQIEETDPETGEIISEIFVARVIRQEDKTNPISPSKYFNTFHYRLFCSIVSISIAIALRRYTGINLPLIWDDILTASDFENTTTIVKFLQEIFRIFKQFSNDLPLQIIIFTHDQELFKSAMDSMCKIDKNDFLFSKLFPPNDAYEENEYKNLIYSFSFMSKIKVANI